MRACGKHNVRLIVPIRRSWDFHDPKGVYCTAVSPSLFQTEMALTSETPSRSRSNPCCRLSRTESGAAASVTSAKDLKYHPYILSKDALISKDRRRDLVVVAQS